MVIRTLTKSLKKQLTFFAVLLLLCVVPLYAQEATTTSNPQGESVPTSESDDLFYFEKDRSGAPTFTQVLRWTYAENVLHYEVTLRYASGQVVFRNTRTKETYLEVHLKPGNYQYKVYAYNMLGALEQESEWIDLEIKQAHMPVIRSISPSRLYIEDEDYRFEINGSGFTEESSIVFTSMGGLIKRVVKPVSITPNKISFNFPNPSIFLGTTYTVNITDPSGLSATSQDFIVRFRKALDFYVGAMYTPWAPVYDKWFLENWNKKFYPVAFTGEVGLVFYKSAFGYVGIEARVNFRETDLENIEADVDIDNYSLLNSLSLLYEYWFVKKCAFFLKVGGGISFSEFRTDYEKKTSLDPMYTIGLGFRIKPIKYLYIDIGCYMDHVINKGTQVLGITPEIGVGFRY